MTLQTKGIYNDQDLRGNKIVNLGTPSSTNDAVNKSYVDGKAKPYIIVDAAGAGDYTDIQSALDAITTPGQVIEVKKGTYTITATSGLLVKATQTVMYLEDGVTVQCNGANVATLIKPNATNLSRIKIVGGKFLQTNATAQGTCFDFSDCPNCVIMPQRIEEFGLAIKITDTTNTSFYSHYADIQVFNCNNGIELSGSQSNFNYFENIRIRLKAGGGGKGVYISDSRGNNFTHVNVEPSTATGLTGIYVDGTSRDNQFVGGWIENNATGVLIDSGASNNIFIGGSITSNTTDITDNGTGTVFWGVNKTGTKLFKIPEINSAAGLEILKFVETASAVNELSITNAATGNAPKLSATGSDTNIDLDLASKGTGAIKSTTKHLFKKIAYFDEIDNGNSGTSKTIDWTAGNKQKITMTGNCTFTFTAPSGPCNLILRIIQDGTGGRTITLPTIKWAGGAAPTWSTAASKIDILSLYYDGSAYYGMAGINFA